MTLYGFQQSLSRPLPTTGGSFGAGGALGPLFVGLMSRYGSGNEIDNMSRAIALGGGVYLVAAFLLAAAALIARRQVRQRSDCAVRQR